MPKALWLKKYKPSVLTPPDKKAQTIFETGNEVGDLACSLFSDGKKVQYSKEFDSMRATTKGYLKEILSHI